MSDVVQYLDDAANHFAHRDWDYTRKHGIKRIQYADDKRDTFVYRIARSFRWLTKRPFIFPTSFKMTLWLSAYALKRQNNLPDGHLDGGNVIVHWEETGEYLEMVQPSVGALLANFLKDEPENKHAKLIIAELERIWERHIYNIGEGSMSDE